MNGEAPASVSWRQLTTKLIVAIAVLTGVILSLGGTLVTQHVNEVHRMRIVQEEDRNTIIDNQRAILLIGEQIKALTDNSVDAKDWRRRTDLAIDALLEEAYGLTKKDGYLSPRRGRE